MNLRDLFLRFRALVAPHRVERELLVELPLDPARRDQRLDAQLQIVEGHGGYANFITRSMAVDMRSHSPASTASCRRPDGVSR